MSAQNRDECAWVQERIGDATDREVALRVEAHLARCEICAGLAATWNGLLEGSRGQVQNAVIAPDARSRVERALDPAIERAVARQVRAGRWHWLGLSFAGVGVLTGAVLLMLFWAPTPRAGGLTGEVALGPNAIVRGSKSPSATRVLEVGDAVVTRELGEARVTLGRASILLDQSTELVMTEISDAAVAGSLARGLILVDVGLPHRKPEVVRVKVDQTVISVVGTRFAVSVERGGTLTVAVAVGRVRIERGQKVVLLDAGRMVTWHIDRKEESTLPPAMAEAMRRGALPRIVQAHGVEPPPPPPPSAARGSSRRSDGMTRGSAASERTRGCS